MPSVYSGKFAGVPAIDVSFRKAWEGLRGVCSAIEDVVPEGGNKDKYDEEVDDVNLDLDWGLGNLGIAMYVEDDESGEDFDILDAIVAYQ